MIIFPMGSSGRFFPRNASGDRVALPDLNRLLYDVCSMCVRPYSEAYYFAIYGHGIFNVSTHLSVCRTHEGGQAQTSLHKSRLGGTEKNWPSPCPPGDRTQSSDFNSDAL